MAMTARVVQRLQAFGLVREAGRSVSPGPGRPTGLLELHPDAARVVAVDIGTESVHLMIVDVHGTNCSYRELSSGVFAGLAQDQIVISLAGLITDFARDTGTPLASIGAAGIALTGMIDSARGISVIRSNTPGWERFDLRDRLGRALEMPVILDETSRAKSVAELRLGSGRGATNFLYVDVGTAIGAGIVINGKPYLGEGGLAGELGHITVDPSGPLCRCGNRGCIQASSSARALVARARELLRGGVYSSLAALAESLELHDIASAANAGDKLALGLLTEAGERLGEAISMALNLLGIEMVILGGSLVQHSPVVLEAASRIVRLRVLPIVGKDRTLLRSELGREAGALGIGLEAVDWLFDSPVERILQRKEVPHVASG
jgi:predicted NBD/HSP70 family sugar kinase